MSQKKNPCAQEEEKKQGDTNMSDDKLNYRQFFKEFVPIDTEKKKIVRKYTVEIKKALYNEESYKVY
jgi:hypothetical protein